MDSSRKEDDDGYSLCQTKTPKEREAKPGPRRPSDVTERLVVGLLEEMGLSFARGGAGN